MATSPGRDEGRPRAAGRAPRGEVSTEAKRERRRFDGAAESGGGEHVSEVLEWRPSYQHEVAVVGWLRHVSCPDGCDETPAAVLRVDNADHAGEIAMTADDLSALVDQLLGLRRALPSPGGMDRPLTHRPDADG